MCTICMYLNVYIDQRCIHNRYICTYKHMLTHERAHPHDQNGKKMSCFTML